MKLSAQPLFATLFSRFFASVLFVLIFSLFAQAAESTDTDLIPLDSTPESTMPNTSQSSQPTSQAPIANPANTLASQESSAKKSYSTLSVRGAGDIAQFLPVATLAYTAILRDFTGFKQQAIGWVAVVASTYAIKYGLHSLAPSSPTIQSLSKRPDNDGKFEGFPSGHSSSAFAAAGFMQKRYGVRLGLPTALVASFVGFSRIHADRHTLVQVICGGLLGFFISFFCARAREPKPYLASNPKQSMTTKSLLLEFGLLSLLLI